MEEIFIQNTNKKKWAMKAALVLAPMLLLLHYEDFLSGDLIYQISIVLGYLLGGSLWGTLAAFVHDWLYFRSNKITRKFIFSPKIQVIISIILSWILILLGFLLIASAFNFYNKNKATTSYQNQNNNEQNAELTIEQKRLLAKELYANSVSSEKTSQQPMIDETVSQKVKKAKSDKFEKWLKEARKRQEFDRYKDKIVFTWFLGLPIFFISVSLLIWAYVIRKHGILVGGSVGIIPPIVIAGVLSPLWPLVTLAAIFVSVFHIKWIGIMKDRYLQPFRENVLKTVSNS